ncbi:MAG: alpha/beta fold hydrolase [Candidatus Pacebacteria bacterium]|nr:alpha/beta fold hydrolase [Candidatus Paceibacterota bacterium]
MKKVLIIHGLNGNPNGGWRPWIMSELQKMDIFSFSLAMPNPDNPILIEWLKEIDRYIKRYENDEIFLIGHSLGGLAILRYLEKYSQNNIKGIVLVATPCNFYEKDNKKNIFSFFKNKINWEILKTRKLKATIIQGDDDPTVPISDGKEIAKKLAAKLIIIPNGKHLNGSAGFVKLPECLEAILNFFKKK